MITEYLKFAGDVVIHMAIIGIITGVTISIIAFLGCFGFWLWDKITKEKHDEF